MWLRPHSQNSPAQPFNRSGQQTSVAGGQCQAGDITVTAARFQVQVDESLTAVNRQRHLTVSREVRDKIRSERKGHPLAGSQVHTCHGCPLPNCIFSPPHSIPSMNQKQIYIASTPILPIPDSTSPLISMSIVKMKRGSYARRACNHCRRRYVWYRCRRMPDHHRR